MFMYMYIVEKKCMNTNEFYVVHKNTYMSKLPTFPHDPKVALREGKAFDSPLLRGVRIILAWPLLVSFSFPKTVIILQNQRQMREDVRPTSMELIWRNWSHWLCSLNYQHPLVIEDGVV